jgi:hypothetical protein
MINWEDWRRKEPYVFKKHGPWIQMKRVGKSYCLGCGLVRLNNPLTRWCMEKGCNHDDHPQYQQKVKQLTKMD